jgi:hypothetical protein
MKEFRLLMQILVMFILAMTVFKELYGTFGVVVVTIASLFYFINEYSKKEE